MSHLSFGFVGGWRDAIVQWIQARIQECVHCAECQSKVMPFASHCPNCGQANPAKVSTSAALCLAVGFVFLVFASFFLIFAF
jgi:hypothetical protein